MTSTDPVTLAAAHDLHLDPASVRLEEAGLDYRVAFARDTEGSEWVLRMPRRPELAERIEEEARTLAFLRSRLPVAVPDWRVRSATLLAYPRLPGAPGLNVDAATQAPIWHMDPTSPRYAEALGRFIAALHGIDPLAAAAAGVPSQSASAVRTAWSAQIDRVIEAFPVAPAIRAGWDAWLADDGLWPDVLTVTHGELYPAHVLIDGEEQIRGVIDWTTAKVSDPAVDFVFQQMMAGPSFELTVQAYEAAGGRAHPRLRERCAALAAASGITYGIFALTTGDVAHRDAATALLDPTR